MERLMSKEFDVISLTQESKFIKRWNGVQIYGHRRSLAEHHSEVAAFALDFIENCSSEIYLKFDKFEVLQYSLTHDLPEVITGDVRYTVKRDNPDLVEVLSIVEERVLKDLDVDKVSPEVKFLVKIFDLLAVEYEICEELNILGKDTGAIKYVNVVNILNTTVRKYREAIDSVLLQCGVEFFFNKRKGGRIGFKISNTSNPATPFILEVLND